MEEFHIPLKPEDLARPSVREDEYRVENEVHPELMKEKDLLKLLDGTRLLFLGTHITHFVFKMPKDAYYRTRRTKLYRTRTSI